MSGPLFTFVACHVAVQQGDIQITIRHQDIKSDGFVQAAQLLDGRWAVTPVSEEVATG